MRVVNANLRLFEQSPIVDGDNFHFTDGGYGEQSILIALTHPDVKVVAHIEDEDRRSIAAIAAKDFVNNIEFVE